LSDKPPIFADMTLACLLPSVFPDLHWVAAVNAADLVLLQDNIAFNRKSRTHRGKFRVAQGHVWLQIPTVWAPKGTPICELRIEPVKTWFPSMQKTISMNYRNSIYFDFYEYDVLDDLKRADEFATFSAFAVWFAGRTMSLLDISWTPKLASNEFPSVVYPDELAALFGAKSLLLEQKSEQFQPQSRAFTPPEFHHPTYYQHFGNFETGCCLLDVLFEMGPEAYKIIRKTIVR
jgi:hypothetical protein